MTYAVIETGGKQYRVTPGQTLAVELLPEEPGAVVTFDKVLMVSDGTTASVGTPAVAGAKVVATVSNEGRGPKIIVFKYKSKKRYRRTTGHRQDLTFLTITDIHAGGKSLLAADDRKSYEADAKARTERYGERMAVARGETAK